MEKGRSDKETYAVFASRFLPGVIGNAVFRSGCCSLKLTEYTSASDETMAFLILANNWLPWLKMAELRKEDPKAKLEDCGVKQKYFKDTKGRGHSWSNAGKIYYNELYDKVLEDRKRHGTSFDGYFLDYMIKNSDEGKRMEKQKRKKALNTEQVIRCKRDLPPMLEGSVISSDNHSNASYKDDEAIACGQALRAGASQHLMV